MPLFNRSLWFYLLVGLCQGVVFWQVESFGSRGVLAASLTLVVVGGLLLQLLGPKLKDRRVLALTLGFCLLMMAISSWVQLSGLDYGNRWLMENWLLTGVPLSYVVCAFLASWPSGTGRRWAYDDLFHSAWSHVFVVFFALMLTGVFSLLLLLWSKLFLMLGIDFLPSSSPPGSLSASACRLYSPWPCAWGCTTKESSACCGASCWRPVISCCR